MKKNLFIILILILNFVSSPAMAVTEQENLAIQKAREDYRIYLQKLKELSSQYKEVTGEIKKVAMEEGVPVWDEDTGEIEVKKMDLGSSKTSKTAAIRSEGNQWVVTMEVPGLKKNTIQVSLTDPTNLKIRADRKEGLDPKVFENWVKLPSAAESKGAEALYEDGILTITLFKASIQSKETAVPVR